MLIIFSSYFNQPSFLITLSCSGWMFSGRRQRTKRKRTRNKVNRSFRNYKRRSEDVTLLCLIFAHFCAFLTRHYFDLKKEFYFFFKKNNLFCFVCFILLITNVDIKTLLRLIYSVLFLRYFSIGYTIFII